MGTSTKSLVCSSKRTAAATTTIIECGHSSISGNKQQWSCWTRPDEAFLSRQQRSHTRHQRCFFGMLPNHPYMQPIIPIADPPSLSPTLSPTHPLTPLPPGMPTVSPVTLQPHRLDHFTVPNIAEIRQAMERLTLEKRAMRTLGGRCDSPCL